MIELQKTLKIHDKDQLIKKLEIAGYAFATWRMPNSTETQFIVSLGEVNQITDFQLSELRSGFLINSFSSNHPVAPHFIAADLIIKNDELVIDPRVESAQLDKFKESISENSIQGSFVKSNASVSKSSNHFETMVEQAIEKIKEGLFEKVVLSRYRDESLPSSFSPLHFFNRISKEYQNAFTSMVFIPSKGIWIGATPELLLSDDKNQFKTVSLAGTKKIEEGTSLSEIAWTQKEIEEQALVSRYIINCFKKIRLREFHEHGPKTIQAGNLAHLKTEFVVDYSEVNFENLADQMMELLHPTSAVCGMPIESTQPWLEAIEDYDREFYSGFLGPVNLNESTNLFVNLRCMKVTNGIVRFFAGAGITEDSNPHKEFLETEMKMNVLKSKL